MNEQMKAIKGRLIVRNMDTFKGVRRSVVMGILCEHLTEKMKDEINDYDIILIPRNKYVDKNKSFSGWTLEEVFLSKYFRHTTPTSNMPVAKMSDSERNKENE